jgi:CubicO group peptidase (beta-lactamase class C family)
MPDEDRVRAVFKSNPAVGDLESLLTDTGTQAFIVIKDDAVIYEHYFSGAQRDTLVTSYSVAKSFDTALLGIAIQEGYIQSVNDPITDYLPELLARNQQFGGITIRNLLQMASGIRFDDERFFMSGDDSLTYSYPDLRELALTKTEIVTPPGEFHYNPYNPILLGLILERTTGRTVTQYLQEKIWSPLAMEFPGSWSLDSKSSGFEKMESGLNARAIDFAKFGRLYLNNGAWNGQQIVPTAWVADSTRPDQGISVDDQTYYGYMWWGLYREQGGYDYFALGDKGQFIYISPARNLIIVRNGERYGLEGGAMAWANIFYQFASDLD